MVVRAADLESGLAQYLVGRVHAAPNVEVRVRSEVVVGRGKGHLETITLAGRGTGAREEVPTNRLCVVIGASPSRTGSATPWRAAPTASWSPVPSSWTSTGDRSGPW